MRLICPNCGAQYEIDASLIPASGRDVQCSDCGHTWLETPGASLAREAEPEPAAEARPEPIPDPTPRPTPAPPGEPDERIADGDAQSGLTDDVARILREEADHERQQRRREAEQIESQPDLGLHVAAPARREQLPDIEEINSSLRNEDETPATEKTPKRSGGFWTGFLFIVLIALLALLVYLFTPQISDMVPQAQPMLDAYVIWVDEMRLRLFEIVERVKAPKS